MASTLNNHGLPSPVASAHSPAPSNASTTGGRVGFPTPRRHALKPGSPKEIALINYLDDKVLRVTRRYSKKFAEPDSANDDAVGYTTIDQAIVDIEPLIDLAWASGTPAIQIPYLLSFAGFIMSYMPAFRFTSEVLRICRKLDIAFSSLLRGTSSEAIQTHPASTTEKVRIKSLVEETRLVAVDVASSSGFVTEHEEESDDAMDVDMNDEDQAYDEEDVSTALAISRMYKSTIEILGDSLVQT